LLLAGQVATVGGSVLVLVALSVASLPVLLVGLFVVVAALGLTMPNATALGMSEAQGRAGSASGVMGISQFTVGSVASPLAGAGGSPWSMAVVIAVSAVVGLAGRLALLAGTRTHEQEVVS
jgi:DHA1 family bicyclomycin/chloramphenicol resistance-like MFS transporter